MYKILTSVVLSGVLLAGCAETAGEVEDQNAVEGAEVEAVDEVEDSVFVDDIQTSFAVKPTKTPTITEEEKVIAEDLWDRVNYSEETLSDRDHVANASEDYPNHTAEELYDIYERYHEDRRFRPTFGDIYVDFGEITRLEQEILDNNLATSDLTPREGSLRYNDDYSVYKQSAKYTKDGEFSNINMWVEFNEEYTEATLLRLEVDGEDAFEYDPEAINYVFK